MGDDAPLVYVITVNWNNAPDTLECLETLVQLTYPNYRLLVVDNGSTDGSAERIAQAFPQAEHLRLPKNQGFAGGFNAGIRYALARNAAYTLLLNNDTLAAPNLLEHLVDACAPPDVGATAPLIFYADERMKIWSAGSERNQWTLELSDNHGRNKHFEHPTDREFLSGCGLLLKAEVIKAVGLFDEGFFLYYEDSDYSLRLRRAGFRLLVVPQAHLWHKVSRSSQGSNSPNERYWMARSSIRFFRKHGRGLQWLAIIPWRIGSAIKVSLRLIWHGNFPAVRAYWCGLKDGLQDTL